MPKVQEPLHCKLKKYAAEFSDVLSTDGKILLCTACDKVLNCERRFQVTQHFGTSSHVLNVKKKKPKAQLLTTSACSSKQATFNLELTKALISADIPLHKLQNKHLRIFLEHHIKDVNIPSESCLRKSCVDSVYTETLTAIREQIGENPIYVVTDETTDLCGRAVCNVLLGPLLTSEFVPPFLIHVAFLEETNHSTIAAAINDALRTLWPNDMHYDRFLLMVTDAAPYMVKAGQALHVLFPKLIHVTCLAHALHRVAECIRFEYADVDKLIATGKQIFVKAPQRRQMFLKEVNIPLPPKPVLTRWGSWIEAISYYAEHYETFLNGILHLELHCSESMAVKKVKDLLTSETIRIDLMTINTHFKIIASTITKLESQGLAVWETIQLIDQVQKSLISSPCSVAKSALEKMNRVMEKNSGFKVIRDINNVISGCTKHSVPNLEIEELPIFKYAPCTSVDVERSFSAFKSFLKSNRSSFCEKNLSMMLIVYYNSQRC